MYLISYDISNDKRRRKIAKTIENYGKRVQYSVFECDLEKDRMKELYAILAENMKEDPDGSIRIYNICENCLKKVSIIGQVEETFEDEGVIII